MKETRTQFLLPKDLLAPAGRTQCVRDDSSPLGGWQYFRDTDCETRVERRPCRPQGVSPPTTSASLYSEVWMVQ